MMVAVSGDHAESRYVAMVTAEIVREGGGVRGGT